MSLPTHAPPPVLPTCQVPVASATYVDDMYVDYNLAQETLQGVDGVRQWVTNEFKHRCVGVGVCVEGDVTQV